MKATLVLLGLGLAVSGCGAAEPGSSAVPSSWRTESWHGVTLRVPSEWDLGYSPMTRRGGAFLCADSRPATPYVGRPQYGSDVCQTVSRDRAPQQEAVWFESPLPVGATGRASGVPSRTVRVGDQKVTVAVRDADQRALILSSARAVGAGDANGCTTQPAGATEGLPTEGIGEVRSMSVCAYDAEGRLTWSGRTTAERGETFYRALGKGRVVEEAPPPSRDADRVVLQLTGDDRYGDEPIALTYVVRLDAAVVECPGGTTVALTAPAVRPWAAEGIRTYVGIGFGAPPEVARYFKPVQG